MREHLENWIVEPLKLAEIGFAAYRMSSSIAYNDFMVSKGLTHHERIIGYTHSNRREGFHVG